MWSGVRSHAVQLIDFGMALRITPGKEVNENAFTTLRYTAPEMHWAWHKEQVRLKRKDPQELLNGVAYGCGVDVWACGACIYKLLCGYLPFGLEDITAKDDDDEEEIVIDTILFEALRFPPTVSQLAQEFCRTLLDRDPTARPSAREALRHPWLSPPNAPQPPAPTQRESSGDCSLPQLSAERLGVRPGARTHTLKQLRSVYGPMDTNAGLMLPRSSLSASASAVHADCLAPKMRNSQSDASSKGADLARDGAAHPPPVPVSLPSLLRARRESSGERVVNGRGAEATRRSTAQRSLRVSSSCTTFHDLRFDYAKAREHVQ